MTPAERLLKAVHMEIDRKRWWLDALMPGDCHQVVIRVKPRGDGYRVSIGVDAMEERV